jgi:hypothetical protein
MFTDGTLDQMTPVDGYAILAGRAQPWQVEAYDASGIALETGALVPQPGQPP